MVWVTCYLGNEYCCQFTLIDHLVLDHGIIGGGRLQEVLQVGTVVSLHLLDDIILQTLEGLFQ